MYELADVQDTSGVMACGWLTGTGRDLEPELMGEPWGIVAGSDSPGREILVVIQSSGLVNYCGRQEPIFFQSNALKYGRAFNRVPGAR